jgi:hypothetical protein
MGMQYHITIYCPDCKKMLYDQRGTDPDEYTRKMDEAIDLKRNRLPASHPGHDLKLDATTKAV